MSRTRLSVSSERGALYETNGAGVGVVDILPVGGVPFPMGLPGAGCGRFDRSSVGWAPVEVGHTQADVFAFITCAHVVVGDGPDLFAGGSHLAGFDQGLMLLTKHKEENFANVARVRSPGDSEIVVRIDGHALFRFATESFTDIIRRAIARSGWSAEETRWIIPHQANGRILKAAAKRSRKASAETETP